MASTSTSGRSIAGWAAVLVVGLALLHWSAFVDTDDLDKADKMSSVIGGFAGVAGLGYTAYAAVARRKPDPPQPAGQAATPRGEADPSGHVISGHVISNSSLTGSTIVHGNQIVRRGYPGLLPVVGLVVAVAVAMNYVGEGPVRDVAKGATAISVAGSGGARERDRRVA